MKKLYNEQIIEDIKNSKLRFLPDPKFIFSDKLYKLSIKKEIPIYI